MPLALHTAIRVSLLIQQGKALYAMQKFKLRMKLNTSPDMCLLDGSPCVFMFLAHLLLKSQCFSAVSQHGVTRALIGGLQNQRHTWDVPNF